MALKACPECGKEVSDKATRCPHCGFRRSIAPLVIGWIIAIPLGILAILALKMMFS
ncbi:MAG: zinc ribbon domain-containing protein [Chthoniobacterales bacterium]